MDCQGEAFAFVIKAYKYVFSLDKKHNASKEKWLFMRLHSDSYLKARPPGELRRKAVRGCFGAIKTHRTKTMRFILSNQRIMQIRPPLPSLMIRLSVSESLTRASSGMCASLLWSPSLMSS